MKFCYDGYKDGVTVVPYPESPTGYLAVFVFDEKNITEEYIEYYRKQYQTDLHVKLDLTRIARVQIYSNTALLFSYDEQKKHTDLDPARTAHTPWEFKTGMYPAGGNTHPDLYDNRKINYEEEAVPLGNGRWGAVIPFVAGAVDYNIRLIDADGKDDGTFLFDPANPPMQNTLSGIYSRSSMVYVPYDANYLPPALNGEYSNPKKEGKTGRVEFGAYEGLTGETRYIGIYVPASYRETGKKHQVVYISHGMQMEQIGCELRWLYEIALQHVLDHLGTDFLLVSMSNTDLKWDQDRIWEEQKRIFQYMEEHYNVSSIPSDRAFTGFSMGGMTTSRLYMKHTEAFGYYGIWNAADARALAELSAEDADRLRKSDCHIQLAYGDWDYCMGTLDAFADGLRNLGIDFDLITTPGSHDWICFRQIFLKSAKEFLFKE